MTLSVGAASAWVTSSPSDRARTSPHRPPALVGPPPSELRLPPLAICAVASSLPPQSGGTAMRRPAFVSGAQKVARPRDGASCSLRCAVMPTLCSGAAPPVVVTPAPTVGWDGHVNAISSGSCGRRCPLRPSCPTPSATGAVALIALLCGACADGGARDGRAAAAWPRGQKLCDAGELEEAESTHHTAVARGNRGARLPRPAARPFIPS